MASDKKRKLPPPLDTTQTICDALRVSFNDLLALKQKKENAETIRKTLTKTSILFSELKQSNRETYFEIDSRKNDSLTDREKLDKLNLQLQELLYERSHLNSEIQACKTFKLVVILLL